jgi:hypothetical protein
MQFTTSCHSLAREPVLAGLSARTVVLAPLVPAKRSTELKNNYARLEWPFHAYAKALFADHIVDTRQSDGNGAKLSAAYTPNQRSYASRPGLEWLTNALATVFLPWCEPLHPVSWRSYEI